MNLVAVGCVQAHDFEAYQEMLQRAGGGVAQGDAKYEAISRFLEDTEKYLHKLASKIASVKLSHEVSEAVATAIAEARAQVRNET